MVRVFFRPTPMQEGMLFHSLAHPHGGVSVEQIVVELPEAIDASGLRRAGEKTVSRHSALRAAFSWDEAGRARQEILPTVDLPWMERDLRALSATEQEQAFAAFLREDRERGFDLERAPLLRLTLHRMADAHFRLTWTLHHVLVGRSYPLLLTELFAFYDRGIELQLPEPADYTAYLAWREAQDHSAGEEFWRQELAGFTAPTPFPIDRLDKVARLAQTGTQRDRSLRLTGAVTQALNALAQSIGVTLGTLVQGAWALLLARYSGEADVVFGEIRAGRKGTVPGADTMVGLFINAVPLRVACPRDALLATWLRTLRERARASRPYELTPLVRVQSWSEVPAGTSLFDTLVVFDTYELEEKMRALGGAWTHRSVRLYEQTNYALTLKAYGGTELTLHLQFDPARFADTTINRLLGHLETLLAAMPTHGERGLAELPLITEAERKQLTQEWNRPVRFFPPAEMVVSRFDARVARVPDRIAVTCDTAQLTYGELNLRANQLAHRLRRLGVGVETRVGVFVERSVDLVVSILGVLKAGGAYVPLDTAYPVERLEFMMNDAELTAVVTQRRSSPRLGAAAAPLVYVDDDMSTEETSSPRVDVQPQNLAYIIYTSGSTGKPKGVLVTHYNVVRLFQATDDWYQFSEDDVWTLFHSCAFDFSVWELWGALHYGGKLVVVPYEVSRSPETFYDLLVREQVTVLNQTPSAFHQLMEVERERPASPQLALRTIIFGGEALEIGSLRPWFLRHGDTRPRLVNMYGITETTVHVTYRPLTRSDLEGGSVIGSRIPDLQLYILDPRGEPVPIGVAGELYVAGAGLARGYWQRTELTAERFVPNPFLQYTAAGTPDCARLYRTGDRAKYLENGDIEYLGRLDQQVKIRGFRIELGEIETMLGQIAGIRAAVVVAQPDSTAGQQRLVAYLVGDQSTLPAASLRELLQRRLPDYMVPAHYVWLERFPLTENGKVDRRALPVPDRARPLIGTNYVAPRTPTEQRVAQAWREVLEVDRVGRADNFFELGGNSISAVQVLARLRAGGFAKVEVADLFQFPTVQALAAHLGEGQSPAAMNDVLRRARRQAAALQVQGTARGEFRP